MKTARWYGILSLSFFLWLLLFPPWMELSRAFHSDRLGTQISTISHNLGHHWRFSQPLHWAWEWSQGAHAWQWSWYPNLAAQIDYHLMLYEAVIGLVATALVLLLLPRLGMPIRKIRAGANVETVHIRTRIQNWFRRVL